MNKKQISSIALSIAAAAGAFGFAGCGGGSGDPQHYNIIFTNSTNPPTLSALLSIKSDDPTYAYIQRGNTYYGIEDTKNFTNIGFNIDKQTNAVTQAEVSKVSDAVKQIAKKKKNSTFTIYVTDYNAYGAFAAAYQAGLDDDDFDVVMVEDGSGSYGDTNFIDTYITGKTVETSTQAFQDIIGLSRTNLEKLKNDPTCLGTEVEMQNYTAWAGLATLDNASFHGVAINNYKAIFETAGLTSSLFYRSINNASTGYNLKMTEGTSADLYASLTDAQKSEYLKLIGGDRVVATLRRTTDRKGNEVSSKKFVIVGSRAKSNTMSMMPDITSASELIAYDSIQTGGSEALKEVVNTVFTTKADYEQVLAILNKAENAFTDAQKVSAFNLFAENKFMFQIIANYYGADRDLIYKGHPSEVVTDRAQWQDNHYSCEGGTFVEAIYQLTDNFFKNDSLGSKIGVAIGGCDMSNYAFFGDLDYSIGGMQSTTYDSYNRNTPVDLIMQSNANTAYEGATTRYLAGQLKDTDGAVTTYLNKGSMYQMLNKESELQTWLVSTFRVNASNAGKYGVNKQGFVAKRSVSGGQTTITDISRSVKLDYNDGGTTTAVTNTYKNGDVLGLETPTREGYTFLGWYKNDVKESATCVVFNTIEENEIVYTAHWAKNYTATIKGVKNGETVATVSVAEGADLVALSSSVTNPNAVAGKTYRLEWHNETDESVVTTMPSSNVILYAVWVETAAVKYSLKKDGTQATIVVDANKTWNDVVAELNKISGIKNPDNENQTVVYGFKNKADDSDITLTNTVDASVEVYAVWTTSVPQE